MYYLIVNVEKNQIAKNKKTPIGISQYNTFTEDDIQTLSSTLRSKLWKEHYEKLWGKHEGQFFGFGEGNLHVTILSITKLKGENNEI